MAKLIKETIERYCCTSADLKLLHPKETSGKNRYEIQMLDRYCIHCGQEFEYYTYMDAAGSRDWDYRPKEKNG